MTDRMPDARQSRNVLAHAVMAATHYLEVRAGHRPVGHLDPLVDPAMQRRIRGLVKRRRTRGGASTVTLRRVFADRHRSALHVVVLLVQDGRLRPVAMGVDLSPGGPIITSIGLPEDHRPTCAQDDRAAPSASFDPVGWGNPHPELLAASAPAPTILRGGRPAA